MIDLSELNGQLVDLSISDANGKCLFARPSIGQSTVELDVSRYENGVYVIRINNEVSSINKKVIIKR